MSQDRSKLYVVHVDWTTGEPGIVSADVVKITPKQVVVSSSLNALGFKRTIRLIDGEPEVGAWTPEGAAERYLNECELKVSCLQDQLAGAQGAANEARAMFLRMRRGEA